jgi:hypothetical protein
VQKTLTEQFAEHVFDIQYETLPNAAIDVATHRHPRAGKHTA